MLESANMTDKELEEAITNHLKKLDDLEVTDNTERKAKLNNSELSNPNNGYYMNYTGDWNGDSRSLPDKLLNATTTGNTEWKCKTPYSLSNTNHLAKCNIIHSNMCSDGLTQRKKFHSSDGSEENTNFLNKVRQHLANYQEKGGISKADYPFTALIKIMGQVTGKSLLALFYIIVNIAPMAQIILFIMRFILDKIINIQKTKDRQQIALKTIFLTGQLWCIYICLTLIITLIWMPILNMIVRIILCCTIDPISD